MMISQNSSVSQSVPMMNELFPTAIYAHWLEISISTRFQHTKLNLHEPLQDRIQYPRGQIDIYFSANKQNKTGFIILLDYHYEWI